LTAADSPLRPSAGARGTCAPSQVAVQHIDEVCRAAADGRRAARALADWLRRFELSEAEFQILWCLRGQSDEGLDQATLAKRLAFSTAQVSATVERIHAHGLILQQYAPSDRRRRPWQLSSSGQRLLHEMIDTAAELASAIVTAGGDGLQSGLQQLEAA
jgi:DNA-binding MarR family transcriptional regulator